MNPTPYQAPSAKRKKGERGGTLEGGGTLERDIRGVGPRGRKKNVFGRPTGLRENAETVISGRGPGPARKKTRGIPIVGRRRRKTHRSALVAKQDD